MTIRELAEAYRELQAAANANDGVLRAELNALDAMECLDVELAKAELED